MAIEQIEKMLNREKYRSIFEEVIFMGEDKYLKYIKENKKKQPCCTNAFASLIFTL